MSTHPIVVGYDGSAGARTALSWALDAAARHTVAVRLVYAVNRVLRSRPSPPMPGDTDRAAAHRNARAVLDSAIVEAERFPVDVSGEVLDGPAVSVLCDQSRHARCVVLGSRGLGGFTGMFVGSVSLRVAVHADGPVVVVRGEYPAQVTDLPVAVGVDDSAAAHDAIGFAMEEAAVRRVGVLAVRAWTPPSAPWRSDVRPLVRDVAELETAEQHTLAEAVRGWREKYPTVSVSTELVASDARHALVAVSHDAQLIVVGSRGRGGFDGLLLGSVSQYLLHHAACPVAVMRG